MHWTKRGFECSVTPGDRAWAQLFYGWALVLSAPEEAIALLNPLVPMWLHRWWFDSVTLVALGEAYLRAGQLEQARATLEQAIEVSQPRGMGFMVAPAQRLLGEVLLAGNRLEESEVRFKHALELLERFKAGKRGCSRTSRLWSTAGKTGPPERRPCAARAVSCHV